ncbi:uncharacterized protein LOC113165215 [Anabas testudineus]|uniref:uncharacterized protein LOC113165215 n=1 Tax=Anabas testudineus TaxID=64144 RepID=UPI000E453E57|nr:uncharacterized protein LOC113165215 [Anabas testudineus]
MSDCEDYSLESWISPAKKKRKKKLEKNKMCVKHTNTGEDVQKKKKKKGKKPSKFKKAMEERKEKKKEKKKKRLSLGLDESVVFTQGYSGSSYLTEKSKPEASHPPSLSLLSQDSKKTKRKKKVAFDLSPGYIRVKRPKFVSSSPVENILPENEAVTDTDSCSQLIKAQQAHSHNDSQCTSDDINSQDLFITQKTFRTLTYEPSSGETSDNVVGATPQQTITQQEMVQHLSVRQIQHDEESKTDLQDPRVHPHHEKAKEHLLKPKAAQIVLKEEEDEFDTVQQNPKRQTELNKTLTEEKRVCGAVQVKPRVFSHYLDDPSMCQQSPSCLLNTDRPSLPPQMSTASISTQTENFFTAELSSYISFCHKSGASVSFETLKPLDLSLPLRARKDPERHLSENMSGIEVKVDEEKHGEQKASSLPEHVKEKNCKDPNLVPSCSSEKKDGELKKEKPAVQKLWCVSVQGKGESTPSPQSESELKSVDTTSSEDNEPACHPGKLDLAQVRAVQMRLNESFFFKAKGNGQSPRPESPLMKLVQGREIKNRKCR